MKISYNWLKQYINTELPAEKVAEILTDTGLEVESIEHFESIKGSLAGLVVGEVKTCEKHPNADRLKVTTVDVGRTELFHIVCGAANVAQGQKVIVATEGTMLYPMKGEPLMITKSKIRGEASEGMICAEDEIGIGLSHEGIIVLPPDTKTGTPANEIYKLEQDFVFEIGLTPNRADAASHIGVARDLAAALNNSEHNTKVELKFPSVDDFKVDNANYPIEVTVDSWKDCLRYSALTISDIEVKESPEWLKNKLKAIGLKPINNIVDVTNFVLHEVGQPLHAFDADKITSKKVSVQKLKSGTKFTALDGVERSLTENDLMICNAEAPMCIAGVFGGIHSGVSEPTKNIFLESAYFNAVTIRKTAKHHGLKTDASFRYERGTDPNITVYALMRAALLIKEIAEGQISSEVIDIYPCPIKDFEVNFSYKNLHRLAGVSIDNDTVKSILSSLDIKIRKENEHELVLQVPSYKVDVQREVDVIEEVLRIYGYNNIEVPDAVRMSLSYGPRPDKEKIKNTISDHLSANGFNEIMNNSLTRMSYYTGNEETVAILNPLSTDLGVLRKDLLYGGLEAISYNQNRKTADLKLYEFGKTYHLSKNNKGENPLSKYSEKHQLALFVTGRKQPEQWNSNNSNTDFYFLKSQVENIFQRLSITDLKYSETENEAFDFGLDVVYKKETLGAFGAVSKLIRKKMDIDTDVFYAEVDWDSLIRLCATDKIKYTETPKFPSVRRDLALVLNKEVKFNDIKTLALQAEKELLKEVNIFDVYEGKNIEEGKKSYAVSFILQDTEKTLTDKQIDKVMEKLLKNFEEKLGAKLR